MSEIRVLFLGSSVGCTSDPVAEFLRSEPDVAVFCTHEKLDEQELVAKKYDFCVSNRYSHIVRQPVIDLFPNGRIINLHISLLPLNRGADPNLWSVLDGTPSGVSIHFLDAGLDTGPLIAQREVSFDGHETMAESYHILQDTMLRLFVQTWPFIRQGTTVPKEQDHGNATLHFLKDKNAFIEDVLPQGWDTRRHEVRTMYESWLEKSSK